MPLVNPGFGQRRQSSDRSRIPPGQYETRDFPVLSLGPTPHVLPEHFTLRVTGLVEKPQKWNWDELLALPHEEVVRDIHCVTKWSKLDSRWSGVSLDYIMQVAGVSPDANFLIAHSDDGYTTNIPLEDIRKGKAWVATSYDDSPISDEHGGPVRLLIPHLYFWKSAKWLAKLEFVADDAPGFWEVRGYHNHGDPWKEERYSE
ncbi:MAG: sulfite oxidase-like oxidoreductase [Patescibacteria group bacterium]|mgnify:FL=1